MCMLYDRATPLPVFGRVLSPGAAAGPSDCHSSMSSAVPSEGKYEEVVDDEDKNLHVVHIHRFLSPSEEKEWYETILEKVPWYRVKYKSRRFENLCTTPCWTNFYGGYSHLKPYSPIPEFLEPLIEKVRAHSGGAEYNSILIRLYYDGNDNIAWHTDGRTFLGDTPTIGSLSLGHRAKFEMRRMHNVWPCTKGDNGIDTSTPMRTFTVKGGDLLLMRGDTQKHWHHRVPQEKYRRPRVNINFRNILPDREDTQRWQHSYYKYMKFGDERDPAPTMYKDLSRKKGSILSMWGPAEATSSAMLAPGKRSSAAVAVPTISRDATSSKNQKKKAKITSYFTK